MTSNPDKLVLHDDWSDLALYHPMPEIDHDRLRAYRLGRIRASLRQSGQAMCVLVNPISLRYAVD
jgi:hypothetical protein